MKGAFFKKKDNMYNLNMDDEGDIVLTRNAGIENLEADREAVIRACELIEQWTARAIGQASKDSATMELLTRGRALINKHL